MIQKQALIVDDNAKNVNVLSRLLAHEGISPVQVLNPRDIDASLNKMEDLSVIFLDLEMPHMDGYQVLENLKSNPRYADIPVIAYTVHVSEIKVAHTKGFDGFIGKPLDSDKFPGQLARILNGDPVWETV